MTVRAAILAELAAPMVVEEIEVLAPTAGRVAVEQIDVPVVMVRHEPVPDSAGPGRHRGGASMLRDTMWLAPTEHHLMSLRAKRVAGFGVEGGRNGRAGGVWVFDPPADGLAGAPGTGPDAYVSATPPGAILRYVNTSAGGWGDPFERDPEAVKRDVRDGYVTIEGARRDYGVVVVGDPDEDPERLALDLEETARLRAQPRG